MGWTEQEIRTLYERSTPEETPEERAAAYPAFRRRLTEATAGFGRAGGAEFLFGEPARCNPVELSFLPFFQAIRVRFASFFDPVRFAPGAFAAWEGAFLESLAQLFGGIALEELERLAGPMTAPTANWMAESALPIVRGGDHFSHLAEKYPRLWRQVIEFTGRQADHLEEVLTALREDLQPAWRAFFGDAPLARVREVSASSSDRHNGGRSVHTVVFEDGRRVVYKPHSDSLSRAFRDWVDGLCRAAGEAPFRLPRSVRTREGAFCEFIAAAPLEREEDAAEYFRRAGFLAGAVFLLKGNDLHAENLIARGREPVIVDLETMIAPRGCLLDRISGGIGGYSVNSTALLPMMLGLPGFREAGFAGLCELYPGAANLPLFQGRPISGCDHPEAVIRGFDLALRTFLRRREEAKEWLRRFEGRCTRMVIRPTYAYVRILMGLCAREPQADPARYRSLLARKLFLPNDLFSEEECAAVLREERRALDRLDVPLFSEAVTGRMLRSMAEEWDGIDGARIAEEEARIRFSLARVRPDAGAAEPMEAPPPLPEDGIPAETAAGLGRMADRLIGLADLSGHSAVVTREQRQFLLSDIPMAACALLDGGLGVLVALGAYRRVFFSRPGLDREIRRAAKKLTDPVLSAMALIPREPGIADGTAGYLLGCRMCFEMGVLEADEFRGILAEVGKIADRERLLRYGSMDPLYGLPGMLYALERLPAAFWTPALERLRRAVREASGVRPAGGSPEEEALERRVRAEMIRPGAGAPGSAEDLRPVRNHSLRLGNSGKLYRAAGLLQQREDPEIRKRAGALCRLLAVQEQIVPGCGMPASCTETGLLHGLPGVLYSVCRYLRPDLVPEI